ncbi:PAS domain-containing protein [Rhizobium sp. PAMB 3174]
MDNKVSIEIYQYWNRLRGQDAAPSRKQIVPSQIASVLPDLFILEDVAGGTPLFRLAGTRICEMFGHELHGRPFTALWNGDNVRNPGEVAITVIRSATPVLLTAGGYSYTKETDFTLEITLLPLRTVGDGCDRALGSMSVIGPRKAMHASVLDFLTLDRIAEIVDLQAVEADTAQTLPGLARLEHTGVRRIQTGPLFGQD